MYKDKTFLALITARGGSKGIPNKNITPCFGQPLIYWTIKAANSSKYIDRFVLSSDDENIMNVASNFGCEVPFKRSESLATDTATSVDVVLDALSQINASYDYVILLQPTSPLRTASHIDEAIKIAVENDLESLASICNVKDHPNLMYQVSTQGRLRPFLKDSKHSRRQDFPSYVRINGAIYINKTKVFTTEKCFISDSTYGYLMDDLHSIDIDTPVDLLIAELILKEFTK